MMIRTDRRSLYTIAGVQFPGNSSMSAYESSGQSTPFRVLVLITVYATIFWVASRSIDRGMAHA